MTAGGVADAANAARTSGIVQPDFSILSRAALLDRDRARAVMTAEGFDALLLTRSANVYHATHYWPASDRMGAIGSAAALVPRDPKAPIAILLPAFSHYYIASDLGYAPGVAAYLIGDPEQAMFPIRGEAVSARETARRSATAAAKSGFATRAQALGAALRASGLSKGVLGVDETAARALGETLGPSFDLKPCEDAARRMRLVRTPAEIALMTQSSRINVEAAHAVMQAARETGSLRGMRARFNAEVAARGGAGVFMVVDGVLAEGVDAPLRDGSAFLIDCVSQTGGYHGDYARTVFLGEPPRTMKTACAAIAVSWADVQSFLKPGVKFSEISARGAAALKALGHSYRVPFGPHVVGLHHTDHPSMGPDGARQDFVLEENVIISVDCPLLEAGHGGTAHLEDLVRITADGCVPIHPVGAPTVTV
jgi:Xaa-Pro aminopeptidase